MAEKLEPTKISQFFGQRLLGIDYGRKVVGLATYSPGLDPYPVPYGKILVTNFSQLLQQLQKVINDEAITAIIFGLPLLTDGTESTTTKKIRAIGEQLQQALPPTLQFFWQDESLTTFEAQDRMKNSPRYNFRVDLKQIDQLAAAIIMEDFFATPERK